AFADFTRKDEHDRSLHDVVGNHRPLHDAWQGDIACCRLPLGLFPFSEFGDSTTGGGLGISGKFLEIGLDMREKRAALVREIPEARRLVRKTLTFEVIAPGPAVTARRKRRKHTFSAPSSGTVTHTNYLSDDGV